MTSLGAILNFPINSFCPRDTNTNYITRRHLELPYQFILSSTHSLGINLTWFPFIFPSIPPLLPYSCSFPWQLLLKTSTWRHLHIHLFPSDWEGPLWVSVTFPCVYLCPSSEDIIFSIGFPLLSLFLRYLFFLCARLLSMKLPAKSDIRFMIFYFFGNNDVRSRIRKPKKVRLHGDILQLFSICKYMRKY